jgi:hypothetical protein
MPVPTTLTDIVTLVAVLLGSIAAGMIFMRSPRSRPAEPTSEPPTGQDGSLPRMPGGDFFTG